MKRRIMRDIRFREAERVMRSNGYQVIRSKGPHIVFSNGERCVALPSNKAINGLMFTRLCNENGIDFSMI